MSEIHRLSLEQREFFYRGRRRAEHSIFYCRKRFLGCLDSRTPFFHGRTQNSSGWQLNPDDKDPQALIFECPPSGATIDISMLFVAVDGAKAAIWSGFKASKLIIDGMADTVPSRIAAFACSIIEAKIYLFCN